MSQEKKCLYKLSVDAQLNYYWLQSFRFNLKRNL